MMDPRTGDIRELTEGEKKKSLAELLEIPIVPISEAIKQQMEAGLDALNRAERRGQGWRCGCRYFNRKRDKRCQSCSEPR